MPQLFDRKCVLIAGQAPPNNFVQVTPDALKIEGLRIDFSIEKDNKPKPNKCDIEVYNLNAKHRGQLDQKGIRVILQAGYAATVAQIFSGDARFINSEKHGPDWITKFECGDGERSYSYARVSESFPPGTSIQTVIGSIVKAAQLDPGNAMQKANQLTRQFIDGYVSHGLAATELTRILEPEQLNWSIQDGRIEVLAPSESLIPSGDVPLISDKTGMIGSPSYGTGEKTKGPAFLKVKSLLQPLIRPGSKFELRSQILNGFYKAIKVRQTGSTHGNDWYSEIEAVPT